jgi:hypothetical protein
VPQTREIYGTIFNALIEFLEGDGPLQLEAFLENIILAMINIISTFY